jgi:hypothetical protein
MKRLQVQRPLAAFFVVNGRAGSVDADILSHHRFITGELLLVCLESHTDLFL